ncbi:amino acid ABC transporter permease [Salidesulfovibrio onnuriiensis]|uniref:amino acid ABC transporter permease n=1 Tax=Salidesulfovibrio onnuriiensis TaxID=2583823 RepID=UPI0011C7E34B|nr:amino acid ABC transporter permease [Salidesulfovibrio onnuriiensis]
MRNPAASKKGLLHNTPYWLLSLVVIGVVVLWNMTTNDTYSTILSAIAKGVGVTAWVAVIAFAFSMLLGLGMGLMRLSRFRVLREVATFYIELIRGVPMLVILYYIAFVGAPGLVDGLNWLFSPLIESGALAKISVRELNFTWRAIIALTIGYSAFIAEIVRAGIESVPRGQREAARSSGLTRWQCMRHVILPQALRNVLPALGNDFVAMIKDSALVSALGVQDITQLGKVYSSSTFKFFETYNVVAYLYLIMTITLSLLVRQLERRKIR